MKIKKKLLQNIVVGIAIVFAFIILIQYSSSIPIDEMPIDYGWDETNKIFTHHSFKYEFTPTGHVKLWENNKLVGAAGLGYSTAETGFYDSSVFTWVWWLVTNNETESDYTVKGYNNFPLFPMFQEWTFRPFQDVKINSNLTHLWTGAGTLTNFRYWYLHSLTEGQNLTYNGTIYTVNFEDTIYLHDETGRLNNILPEVDFSGIYTWKYQDLIDSGYNITDILIGNSSLIGYDGDILFMAVGITKEDGIINLGDSLVYDPLIDKGASSLATFGDGENIVRTESGHIYIAYANAEGNISFANVSEDEANNETAWTIQDIGVAPHSVENVGILTSNSTDSNRLTIYYKQDPNYPLAGSKVIRRIFSVTNGSSWSTPLTIFSPSGLGGAEADQASCVRDNNFNNHCCGTDTSGALYYFNSSNSWGTDVLINGTSKIFHCDIEVDNNNVPYIVGVESNDDEVHLWSNDVVWNETNKHIVVDSVGAVSTQGYSVSIAIDDFNNILIASINQSSAPDLLFTYGKTTNLSDWTTVIVDTSASYFPDVSTNGVTANIVYQDYKGSGFIGNRKKGYWATANFSDITSWAKRMVIPGGFGSEVYVTIQDTHFPKHNRMDDKLRTVYTIPSLFIPPSHTVGYDEFNITNSSCIYSSIFLFDWIIKEHCQFLNEAIDTTPYDLNITSTGRLNLTGNSNLTMNSSYLNGDEWSIEMNDTSFIGFIG